MAPYSALNFFAGSGLVDLGLEPEFETVWANDNSSAKRDTYIANHPWNRFHLGDIRKISGGDMPAADLAWASFPCQDLSLAGNMSGMATGTRSGLFWEWIRIIGEMTAQGKRPPILTAENVVGFVVAEGGAHFREAYRTLRDLGYRVGALVIDAREFVPQSRQRAFVVAVSNEVPLEGFVQEYPTAPFHTAGLIRTVASLEDSAWVWWSIPTPKVSRPDFAEICDRYAPCDTSAKTSSLCEMLSDVNRKKLDAAVRAGGFFAGTAYRRTRPNAEGRGVQRLEIRFDGLAGCLRTPNGGSSRQTVILVDQGKARSRLMTVRECARLMGAPDSYIVPGNYNDGYHAMGDAVVVPVTRWLAQQLLSPIAERARKASRVAPASRNAA